MTISTKTANREITNADVHVFGNEHDLFMEDAMADWGKYNLRFLQYHHPAMLAEFTNIGNKLLNGTDDERKFLYAVLTCSEFGPCKRAICPLCELEEQEKLAAALAPASPDAKQSANAPQVQSAALTALLDQLKTSHG